jgi:hypothetical protein
MKKAVLKAILLFLLVPLNIGLIGAKRAEGDPAAICYYAGQTYSQGACRKGQR